jgi:hypothetical protein
VNVVVLDPRVTYQGLLHFFEDDLELSSNVQSSRIAFEKHFLDNYASTPNAQTPTSRAEMIDPRSRTGSCHGSTRDTQPNTTLLRTSAGDAVMAGVTAMMIRGTRVVGKVRTSIDE